MAKYVLTPPGVEQRNGGDATAGTRIALVQVGDRIARLEVPEGTTPQQVESFVHEQLNGKGAARDYSAPEARSSPSAAKNIGMGMLKGAADIGATLLSPIDYVTDKVTGNDRPVLSSLITGQKPKSTNEQRREAMRQFFEENADPESLAFKGGELVADVAGTAGVGGTLAKGARAAAVAIPALAKYAPRLASALESGGLKLDGESAPTIAGKAADLGTRFAGGAATGAASAGLVDPENARAGAAIGALLPPGVKAAGAVGSAVAGKVSPEVKALYEKAKSLGIDIPLDRVMNSRPLNALAASLNYVPLSGRGPAEEKMVSQFNRAVSRTFGQDSPNITQALRRASQTLGDQFENTLQRNGVAVDDQFLTDLAATLHKATNELSDDGARIIGKQIDDILAKVGPDDRIDWRAAYNVKKALDRIGQRNSSEAFYATDLRKDLMGALNRSLGPEEAAKFAQVRRQYGNMLELENLAQNGAEGRVSIARLANLKNLNNQDLQDLADIAAQFLRTREGPHGAAQRVVLGALTAGGAAASPGSAPAIAGGIAAARLANTALNSNAVKGIALGNGGRDLFPISEWAPVRALLYNAGNRSR